MAVSNIVGGAFLSSALFYSFTIVAIFLMTLFKPNQSRVFAPLRQHNAIHFPSPFGEGGQGPDEASLAAIGF